MKINFFKPTSALYPFRWFIVIAVVIMGWMVYADLTGWRIFSFRQQQWNASGPGAHSHK